jgi:hypothetical protein
VAKSEKFDMGDRSYRYSTWKDICDSLYPPLLAQGLVFTPRQSVSANGWVMLGTLFHTESGQWISSTAPIRDVVDGYGQRSDSQSFEIACTYARKNLLMTLAGGFAAGDEASEQESAVPQVSEDGAAQQKLDAVRLKVEAGLEQFKSNPSRTSELFARMDELVEKGELRATDCDELKKRYAMKEKKNAPQKKEVAVAN